MSLPVRTRVVVAVCALGITSPILAGCSGSAGPSAKSSTAVAGITPMRWWSNGQVEAGSTIALSGSDGAAKKLTPSRPDYCSMLKQTVAAGKSILPGVTASDPALLASTKAFVDELQHVAPASVAPSWKVLGSALVALVGSGGNPVGVKGIDVAAVQRAGSLVAADAKRSCGVDLAARKPAK